MPRPEDDASPPGHAEPEMSPRDLTLIVAATSRMGIGRGGTLPWTGLKQEMAYFARVTKRASPGTANVVLMGRKTWESIPPRFRPLKDRVNVVVTRAVDPGATVPSDDGGVKAGSLEAAIRFVGSGAADRRTFVIGGAQIYREALERAETKRILLTRVLSDFDCDTFFPVQLNEDGKAEGWERKTKQELDQWVGEAVADGVQEENGTKYVFEMWERT